MRQIADDSLKSAIRKYIQSTNLDTKIRYISVNCRNDGNKILYTISAGRSYESYKLAPPDYFSSLDSAVVIIRITDNKIVKLDDVSEEIDLLMNDKGIILETELMNYDPPIWILKKCEDDYELIKKVDMNVIEYVPCNYLLKRDFETDSLTLLKIKK
ncbi:MAG TPA: hypothetical protein VIM65_17230 [Cyclobacteriaceae bacterium]